MSEYISESLINQLRQYLQQKPAREPAVNRGHRLRNIVAGRVNRKRPLDKYKSINSKINPRINYEIVTATAAPIYNVVADDYHLSVTVGLGVIVNLLPAINTRAGKTLVIKDTTGGCAGLTPITITPAGVDTLDTFPGALAMIIPFQVLKIMSDGVGNWEII